LREWGKKEGRGWVVREGVEAGGEMTQALYAHMNKKKKKL
jgi:NaMN:DMB phosphoribosyltransferase